MVDGICVDLIFRKLETVYIIGHTRPFLKKSLVIPPKEWKIMFL